MIKLALKAKDGTIKASIITHHEERAFLRDLVAESMRPGEAFGKFGSLGDTISVERYEAAPASDKLVRLCSSEFQPYEDEPDIVTVAVYRVIDEAVKDELDRLLAGESHAIFEGYVLNLLGLTDGRAYNVAPGAKYSTYDVERIVRDLIAVREVRSMNI